MNRTSTGSNQAGQAGQGQGTVHSFPKGNPFQGSSQAANAHPDVITGKIPGYNGPQTGQSQTPDTTTGPLTKTGFPDRRFKGQRDLPPPPEYPVAGRPGPIVDEVGHILTQEGKPDRRFKGNRELSDKEVAIAQAKWVLDHNGELPSKK